MDVCCFILGSIPWFFVAELFKTEHRSAATGLSVLTNWFANFLVGIGYPPLQVGCINKVVTITVNYRKFRTP